MSRIKKESRKSMILIITIVVQFIVILGLLLTSVFLNSVVEFDFKESPSVYITHKLYSEGEANILSMPLGRLVNFDSLNITNLNEVKSILMFSTNSAIKTISQSQYSHAILALSSTSEFASFDLFSNEIESLIDFAHVSLIDASIDNTNSIIMMTFLNQESGVMQKEVWDLGSFQKIIDNNNLMLEWENYYLLPSGEYAVVYDYDYPSMFMIDDFNTNTTIETDLPYAKEEDQLGPISGVAGDQFSEYLAVGFENGKIIIGSIELGNFISGGLIIDDLSDYEKDYTTQDLFFSYDNQYLVWLTEDKISVWYINVNKASLLLDEAIANGNVAAIDRSGQWLAVGTADSLVFYDLKQQYTSYQENYETPNTEPKRIIETNDSVSSIFFSLDNTMLFWGDDKGQIHIWGAIEK